MNFLMLFKGHRDLYEASLQWKQMHDETVRAYESKLKDLETQLAQTHGLDVKALAEELFQDRPYEGRIPDEAWLTPGDNDRTER